MSMCKAGSCVVEKGGFAMTSTFSWQNSVSLCLASFCTPKPKLPVTPGISWLPTITFQSPMMSRTSFFFFLVLVLGSLVGLHRTDQLQLLQHPWLGHRLGYCDIECSVSEMNWDNFIIFEVAPKYCILNSCWLWRLHHFYVILAHSSRYNVHLNLIHLLLSMLVQWFLRCWCLLLSSPAWSFLIYLDSWTQHSRFLGNMFFTASDFNFQHQTHPQLRIISTSAQLLHSFWSYE